MRIKDHPKIIEREGEALIYCPDCKRYLPEFNQKGKRNFPLWKARKFGTYCRYHHAKRQAKRSPIYYKKNKTKIYAQQVLYRERVGIRKKGGVYDKEN